METLQQSLNHHGQLSNGGCFNCSGAGAIDNIPRDKQTYCTKCFETLFEDTFKLSNGKPGAKGPPKVKPPPPPTKPSKEKIQNKVQDTAPGTPFQCLECKTSLHGKVVESLAGKVYCRSCYDHRMKKVCCTGCNGEFTKENTMVFYSENPWHASCFRCSKCTQPIGPKSFSKEGAKDSEYRILCEDCYFEKSGKQCAKCNQTFSTSGFWFRNQHWHKACFTCSFCREELGDKDVFVHDDNVFCGPCYDQQFLKKCTGCQKPLTGEMIEYEGHPYHVDCFCCDGCSNPLGDNSFIPREGKIFCETCFVIKYAKMCKKCSLAISPTSGMGMVYRGDHFHRECFTCTHCEKSLTGELVHSQKEDDRPFCADCYDDLFSKRCVACTKIISGVTGSKYIAFEDRHWHESCFNCHLCQSSLANRKVAFRNGNLICAPCLMTQNLK